MNSETKNIDASGSMNLLSLKQRYFSIPGQCMELKKGDVIMRQGELNQRIFYVDRGRLTGHFAPAEGDSFEIFNTGPDMMVGIFSFFSDQGLSYTTVTAAEDSTVSYIHRSQVLADITEFEKFSHRMLPIIINEIYLRQMKVVNSAKEKEAAMRKLHQSEKLATLGQLAAGLAHELNNAIGVINNQSKWLTESMTSFLKENDPFNVFDFFLKGLNHGQSLSSGEIRKRKNKLVETTNLKDKDAKKLARIDMDYDQIEKILKKNPKNQIDQIENYWETGLALHDIKVASDQTKHVVQSIKDLGRQNNSEMVEFDLSITIKKALALLSQLTKKATIELELKEELTIIGREGDFIQVWLNIIKNGLESVLNANISEAKIHIKSNIKGSNYQINIIDNGPGIPEELQGKIFQPNVTTKVHGLSFGLGLGLSIVQKIVNGYGGNITVSSNPGHTDFQIELPKTI